MKLLVVFAATVAVALGCSQSLTGSGTFASPNHPSNYDSSANCAFTLTADAGKVIRIEFTAFDLESSSTCSYDYVTINGVKYCGTNSPGTVTLRDSQTVVSFTSDSSVTRTGFSASFTSVDADAIPATTSAPQTPGCGGSSTSATGTFVSPNHPNNYDSNMECVYTINAPGSGNLIITIGTMDIEASSTCSYDYLEIREGSATGTSKGKFCGSSASTVSISGTSVHMKFVSDSSVVGTGFSLSWKEKTCADVGGECVASCDGTQKQESCEGAAVCCVPRFDQGDCGNIPLNPGHRIIGGAVSGENAWPWQASLQTTSSSFHFCGASLVKEQWVVTAAHCVDGSAASSIKVILGEHHLGVSGAESTHTVQQIIMHEDYENGPGAFPNDIALLKLAAPVTYSEYIQPACLAEVDEVFHPNNNCWITGWGNTENGSPDELVELNIDVLDQPTCSAKWGSSYINDGHICLGNGLSGACNGDSGGPLVCEVQKADGTYYWKLAGATSWGRSGCQTEGYPSVYSRISYFHQWLVAKIQANGN